MKIVYLKDKKFGNRIIRQVVTGYALFEEGKGYYAFSHMRDRYGILIPYIPRGGKAALQSIISDGGFITMEGMEFVNEYMKGEIKK